jgi:hypothetical protein
VNFKIGEKKTGKRQDLIKSKSEKLQAPTETLNAASLTLTGMFGAVIGPKADVVRSFSRNALPSGGYPAQLKKHPPVGRMLFSTVP